MKISIDDSSMTQEMCDELYRAINSTIRRMGKIKNMVEVVTVQCSKFGDIDIKIVLVEVESQNAIAHRISDATGYLHKYEYEGKPLEHIISVRLQQCIYRMIYSQRLALDRRSKTLQEMESLVKI